MKKILSIILSVIILMSAAAITAGAKGTLIFSDDFNMGFKPANWIQGSVCSFSWDSENQCIQGYGDARVLQTNYSNSRDPKKWDKFYASFDFQIRGFDDIDEPTDIHSVGLWVRDMFENEDGSEGAAYIFYVDLYGKDRYGNHTATPRAYVKKEHDFKYRDENNIVQSGSINQEIASKELDLNIEIGEDAPWYNIGVRVDAGKLECYFEQELIFSLKADENDEKLGGFALNNVDATLGSQRTPVLFLASKYGADLWIAIDNFEVWTPDYDFVNVVYGDANDDIGINLMDAILMMQYIAKWDVTLNESASDVNGDGSVNISDVILIMQYIAKWDVTLGPTA